MEPSRQGTWATEVNTESPHLTDSRTECNAAGCQQDDGQAELYYDTTLGTWRKKKIHSATTSTAHLYYRCERKEVLEILLNSLHAAQLPLHVSPSSLKPRNPPK